MSPRRSPVMGTPAQNEAQERVAAHIRDQARYDARFDYDHFAERVHAMACAVEASGANVSADIVALAAIERVDAVEAIIIKRKGKRP